MKYTPGPWRAGYGSEIERSIRMLVRAEEQDGQPYIAVVVNYDGRHEANARLIAAAPKLLAACETGLALLALHFEGVQNHGKSCACAVCEQMRVFSAAIAEATGEGATE